MRSFLILAGLALGLAQSAPARADSPASAVPLSAAVADTGANHAVAAAPSAERPLVLVQENAAAPRPARRATTGGGDLPWLIVGAVGALVPLALFAVPALVLSLFGPFAPLAFFAAVGVAAITTALGGAVAWGLAAIFTNTKSGFFLPIFYSTLTGMGITFLSGLSAAAIVWGGVAASFLLGGAKNIYKSAMPDFRNPFGSLQSGALVVSAAIASVVWGGGVVLASLGGPMVAAFTYKARGSPKHVSAPSVETPSGNYSAPHSAYPPGTYTPPRDETYPR